MAFHKEPEADAAIDDEVYESALDRDETADEAYDDLADEEIKPTTFTEHGRTYVISLTKSRLDLYEQRHKPVMASFIQNEGAFSAAELTALLAYGLRLEGGAFVNPRKGMVMAERIIKASGYISVYEAVMEALERDCGFLFMGA